MKLQAIAKETHTTQRWQHPPSHRFVGTQTLLPLVAFELSHAVLHFPIALVAKDDSYVPMAVLGFRAEQNLFVAPDGRWLAPYVPASIRCYPFHLATSEKGEKILCIDTDLLSDTGEPFFANGEPTQAIRDILNHLMQTEQSRQATAVACAALQKHQLIVPWPITVQGEQDKHQVDGLFKIDEAVLNQLPGEALTELVQSGALALAYCQMISMQHLTVLGQLAQEHAKAAEQAKKAALPTTQHGDLNLEFLSKDGVLTFGN